MNQEASGRYIRRKRRERNLTQAQLAERLGVSNKTVSKWERGACMPDYGVLEDLCDELGMTPTELIGGADADADGKRGRDERQHAVLVGMLLIVVGVALLALSRTVGGSDARDFFSGALLGVSLAVSLVGVYCIGAGLGKS